MLMAPSDASSFPSLSLIWSTMVFNASTDLLVCTTKYTIRKCVEAGETRLTRHAPR